jgi:hypothetical protein
MERTHTSLQKVVHTSMGRIVLVQRIRTNKSQILSSPDMERGHLHASSGTNSVTPGNGIADFPASNTVLESELIKPNSRMALEKVSGSMSHPVNAHDRFTTHKILSGYVNRSRG